MFDLGQTVSYDISIFSLHKSEFIVFVVVVCLFLFLQKDEDITSSGYHGCWWSIKRDEASFLVDCLLQPNLDLVRIKDDLISQ